jgi:hypothetical protein
MKGTLTVALGLLMAGGVLLGQNSGGGMMGRKGMGNKGMMGQMGQKGGCCEGDKAPIASNPVVDLKGKIARVQIARGQGMPFLEVKSGDKTSKVFLGAMPYLMAQGFNPKVDEDAEIKAYKTTDDFIAISVTLPGQNKTLKFRDEKGFPLWRGGMRGAAPAK